MRTFIKIITLIFSISLLAQPILAQETLNDPIALPDLQQQANQNASVLKDIGLPLFAVASSVGVLVAARYIVKQNLEIKNLKEELKKLSQTAQQNATLKSHRQYYEYIIDLRDKEVQKAQEQLAKQNTAAQQYLAGSISISEKETAFLDKCAELLLEADPKEQTLYRKSIYQDRVFTRMSAAEQAKFRSALEELVRAVRAHQPLTAETYQVLGRMILHDSNIPLTQRLLRGLGSRLIQKGSAAVLPVALLTAGIITAQAAENQSQNIEQANRIRSNINLFLEADMEELQKMQASPVLYQACVESAAVLDLLANHTTQEELVALKHSFPKPSVQPILPQAR